MSKDLPPQYNPKDVEDKIYRIWEKSGFFNPDKLPPAKNRKKTFSIVVPPPNITGSLHMGHALNATIQDILIRKKRMAGYKTLWLPGTDHASIATQYVVEKELKKEGLTRHDLGKEKFMERVWQWKEKYGNIILEQFKKLGCSMDWSRTRFTMDPEYQEAVREAFWHYDKKGLVYQGERTVNWCVRCATSLSDLEVEYKEEDATMYYIKYGPLVIATVRPETKLGDTAVAVNPKDKRYNKYIGQELEIETVLGPAKMKVIGDEEVDMEFGTGAMKVTPAHDLHDYELSEKHGLAKKQVIGPNGRMTKLAGKYAGLKISEARKQIVEDMKTVGILLKTKPYKHNIAICYRCGSVLEPLLSKQWFLKMKELASLAVDAVKKKKVAFYPKRWEKIYFDWLKHVRDWPISRQLWWGQKIPVDPVRSQTPGASADPRADQTSNGVEGTEDIFDTWFSSALWPLATLGWPEKTKDFKNFYPTSVLSTARDIINLWVARMIFSGLEFTGQEPFRDVIIHATILTKEGKRMSKSLGTGIDPMDLIGRYGADATRFGLIWQAMGTQDIHWAEEHVVAGKKFANKIWNAARFVLLQTAGGKQQIIKKPKPITAEDQRILKGLEKTKKEVEKDSEKYEFSQALHKLYDFFWHEFCDEYLEASKIHLLDKKLKGSTQNSLLYILTETLKLLHPFMPFITEEIWNYMPLKNKKLLLVEEWPYKA